MAERYLETAGYEIEMQTTLGPGVIVKVVARKGALRAVMDDADIMGGGELDGRHSPGHPCLW